MQDVTLHLSDSVMQRAHEAAKALQQPVDQVLAKLVGAALPDVSDAPADMKPELARMAWLDTQELWAIAQATMTDEQQKQLRQLTELQARRDLTREEYESLDRLRKAYGRITLLKAHAYALLSLRGGHPLLAEN